MLDAYDDGSLHLPGASRRHFLLGFRGWCLTGMTRSGSDDSASNRTRGAIPTVVRSPNKPRSSVILIAHPISVVRTLLSRRFDTTEPNLL